MEGLTVLKRNYPGRLTREEWRALSHEKRDELARRAQCDLLGSFRFCINKRCRRARSCAAADPGACAQRLWQQAAKRSNTVRSEYARLAALPNA